MAWVHRALAASLVVAGTSVGLAGEAPIKSLPPASAEAQQKNQSLADELAQKMREAGQFRGCTVDVETDGGVVTLSGSLLNASQQTALTTLVRRHPGVVAVLDRTEVAGAKDLFVANYQPAAPKPGLTTTPAPSKLPEGAAKQEAGQLKPVPVDQGQAQVLPPAPIQEFPGGIAPYSDAPTVPPYSWPAYTPYNNFASVAMQTQYPAGAWPFIGPPYPYPMIPSGWRRVTLKWSKGYWWLKFHAH